MTSQMITVIDYGSGNLRSAAKACEHAADNAGINARVVISNKPEDITAATHLVLPGQGAFQDCMKGLQSSGLLSALQDAVLSRKTPFLGICVGMQLLATRGEEHGTYNGLGWIDGTVTAIAPQDKTLKIPHMGWNDLEITAPHPVLAGINTGVDMYFVHSYQFQLTKPDALIARCQYDGPVTAIIAKDNIIGTQFHPEKSADAGLRLISNFLRWKPTLITT